MAGLSKETQEPLGGGIDKNSQGESVGVFRDAAGSLILQVVPEPTSMPPENRYYTGADCREIKFDFGL